MNSVSSRKKRRKILYIVLLLTALAIFYLLNRYTPLNFKDDYNYSYSMATGEKLSSVSDILSSLAVHYTEENGRLVNNFIEQLLLLSGKKVFDMVNTALFFSLCLLISVHALGRFDRKCLWVILPVISAFFLYTPYFADNFLWVSGSCNYVISAVFVLLYLLPYRLALERSDKKGAFTEILLFAAMTVFGCIAGNTMENAGIALLFCVIAFLILFRFKGVRYRLWMFSPGIPAGLAFLLSAPGELSRMNRSVSLKFMSLIRNTVSTSIAFVISFYVFIIILSVSLYLFFSRSENRNIGRFLDFFAVPLVYLIGMLASEYSLIAVESGIGVLSRVWLIPYIFLLIITVYTVSAVRRAFFADRKKLKPAFIVLALLVFASFFSSFQGLVNVKNRYSEYRVREKIIAEQKSRGEQTVRIPSISSSSRYSIYFCGGEDLHYGENSNPAVARYYGVSDILRDDSIILK